MYANAGTVPHGRVPARLQHDRRIRRHGRKPSRCVLTSLALSCVSNMVGRGRELQGEWPRSLYADHASFSA